MMRNRLPAFAAALFAGAGLAHHLPMVLPDQEVLLDGRLVVLYGDPDPSSGEAARRLYLLYGKDGQTYELEIARATFPEGGIPALLKRDIQVRAKHIPDEPVHSSGALRRLMVDEALPINDIGKPTDEVNFKVTGTQPYISLLCKFTDGPVDPRPQAYFTTQLGNVAPGFGHYFREASYDTLNLDGSGATAVWASLGNPRSFYINGVKTPTQYLNEIFDHCTAAHTASVNYPSYYGINIMLNDTLENAAWGGGRCATLDGQFRCWPSTWMPYHGEANSFGWRHHAVLGHELSHSFGAPHSESPDANEYGSAWDVVSNPGATCATIDAGYGCLGQHMNAYAKTLMGIIPAARIATHSSGSQSYNVERLAQPANAGGTHQMVRVNIAGTATRWYTVESRLRAGYDTQLPGDGVVIHEINTLRPAPNNHARLVVPGGSIVAGYGRNAALWQPGMVFQSSADNVRIAINSISGTGTANVTVGPFAAAADTFPPACGLPGGWSVPAGATTGWSADPAAAAVGTCSMKSNPMANPTGSTIFRAQIEYTGTFAAGNITFWARTSSEPRWDCLRFTIDGTQQNIGSCTNGGGLGLVSTSNESETGWRFFSIPVSAGTHTVRWSYDKDQVSIGLDAAWIDSVTLPTVGSLPDLSVTQSATPSPANVAKDVVYTITVANTGAVAATGVTITDTLPPGSTFVWAAPGCSFGAGTVTCNVGNLANGANASYKVVIRPTGTGPITNNITVAGGQSDANMANNASALDVTVNSTPAAAQVQRYRLYSPVTLEHHFTTDLNEYNVLGGFVGTWVQEGTVGRVLNNPGTFNGVTAAPYYRLYDNNTRWHHWTTDVNEYYTLVTFPGWVGEGVDGYILPTPATGTVQLFRLLYPFVGGLHHWTIDTNEYNVLTTSFGWIGEGGSGYVIQ